MTGVLMNFVTELVWLSHALMHVGSCHPHPRHFLLAKKCHRRRTTFPTPQQADNGQRSTAVAVAAAAATIRQAAASISIHTGTYIIYRPLAFDHYSL